MAHIVVLFHRNEIHRDPTGYVIHKLADTWRVRGDKVTYLFGPQTYVPADVVIVHVDLSVAPEPYLEFAAQYSMVLNGDLRHIRKNRISRTLVKPGDGWHGPVIVKSDLNYAGRPERMFEGNWLERRWALTRRIARAGERVRNWNMPVREASEYAVSSPHTTFRLVGSPTGVPSSRDSCRRSRTVSTTCAWSRSSATGASEHFLLLVNPSSRPVQVSLPSKWIPTTWLMNGAQNTTATMENSTM